MQVSQVHTRSGDGSDTDNESDVSRMLVTRDGTRSGNGRLSRPASSGDPGGVMSTLLVLSWSKNPVDAVGSCLCVECCGWWCSVAR